MKFEAVIFDLDGTLLDTLEDIANAMNRVLEKRGFPVHDVDEYRQFVGDGVAVLVERVLPEDDKDSKTISGCLEDFREDYGKNWKIMTRPYDGIPETLDELAAGGFRTAVLSNKPHDITNVCVDELLSNWTFDLVLGQREGVARKPDPAGALQIAESLKISPREILYLGDTSIDMKTAVSAGMYPVGALWGFRSMKELKSSGARKVVERPEEILPLVYGKD